MTAFGSQKILEKSDEVNHIASQTRLPHWLLGECTSMEFVFWKQMLRLWSWSGYCLLSILDLFLFYYRKKYVHDRQKNSKVVWALFPLEISEAVAVISVPPKYILTSIFLSLPLHVFGDWTLTLLIFVTSGSVKNCALGCLWRNIQISGLLC